MCVTAKSNIESIELIIASRVQLNFTPLGYHMVKEYCGHVKGDFILSN